MGSAGLGVLLTDNLGISPHYLCDITTRFARLQQTGHPAAYAATYAVPRHHRALRGTHHTFGPHSAANFTPPQLVPRGSFNRTHAARMTHADITTTTGDGDIRPHATLPAVEAFDGCCRPLRRPARRAHAWVILPAPRCCLPSQFMVWTRFGHGRPTEQGWDSQAPA